jgi:WD40 repeat protein
VKFSPDGKFLAYSARQTRDYMEVHVWNILSGDLIILPGFGDIFAFNHNGTILAVGASGFSDSLSSSISEEQQLSLWQIKSGELIQEFQLNFFIKYLVFQNDDSLTVIGGEHSEIKRVLITKPQSQKKL